MNKSVCVICADYLTCSNSSACPCGHIFHYECIIRWKNQSSTCPQCRIKFKEPIKLYFELSNEEKTEGDPAVLRNEVTDLNLKLKVKDSFVENLKKDIAKYSKETSSMKEENKTVKQLLENALGTNDALKKQLAYVEKFKDEAKKNKASALALEKKLASYKNLQALLDAEYHDIESTIKNFADSPDSFHQVVTSYVVMKKEFSKLKEVKKKLENEKNTFRKRAELAAREAFESKEQLKVVSMDLRYLDEKNKTLSEKLSGMEPVIVSPSPRSSTIKRLLQENPAPVEIKRKCLDDMQEGAVDKSVFLFEESVNKCSIQESSVEDSHDVNEDSLKIADEFGLQYVATTSIISERAPLNEINKNKSRFGPKTSLSKVCSTKVKKYQDNTDLAHVRQGFNGMGGHSKVLVIPKKTATYVKPGVAKKIPRNINFCKNAKIYDQLPRLPHFEDN